MKITLSNLIAADRFMDRCGLSFINNIVNSILKIYLRCTGKESLEGSALKREWSIYVKQKDAASCAAGFIPVLGSIFIVAKERFNENRADAALDEIQANGQSLFNLDKTQKEKLSYSSTFSAALVAADRRDEVRFDQLYKLGELQRLEALEDSMDGDLSCDVGAGEEELNAYLEEQLNKIAARYPMTSKNEEPSPGQSGVTKPDMLIEGDVGTGFKITFSCSEKS